MQMNYNGYLLARGSLNFWGCLQQLSKIKQAKNTVQGTLLPVK